MNSVHPGIRREHLKVFSDTQLSQDKRSPYMMDALVQGIPRCHLAGPVFPENC